MKERIFENGVLVGEVDHPDDPVAMREEAIARGLINREAMLRHQAARLRRAGKNLEALSILSKIGG